MEQKEWVIKWKKIKTSIGAKIRHAVRNEKLLKAATEREEAAQAALATAGQSNSNESA